MHSFTLNGIRIGRDRPVLMGIINISPESFYPDSFVPFSSVRETLEQMLRDGADIVDIGARSTAPGSPPLSVADEIARVKAGLSELAGYETRISLDTMFPEVLEAALRYDICLANDISGLKNPKMGRLIADAGIPAVLMTCDDTPGDAHSFSETMARVGQVLTRADTAGITDIILDPGIGRWIPERRAEHDWEICRRFGELKQYNLPLLAAVSRKTFIGDTIGRTPDKRLAGTLAVTADLIAKGASVIRAHDVAETRDVILTARQLQESL